MNAAGRRRLTPALVIIVVILIALLAVLGSGLGRGAHWYDHTIAPHLPATGVIPAFPDVPALDHFADVWQKPLFSPTRTPEPVAMTGAASRGELVLTGVIMLPGLRMAILHDEKTGKDYLVLRGQVSAQEPTLVALHPRGAVVDAAGTRLALQLIPGVSPQVKDSAGSTRAARPDATGMGAPVGLTRHDEREAARVRMSQTDSRSVAVRGH